VPEIRVSSPLAIERKIVAVNITIARMAGKMKTTLASFLAALSFCASATLIAANEFKSAVILGGSSLNTPIDVPSDRFLVIRTFTQSGGSVRGVVTLTMLNGLTQNVNVLSASLVPSDNTTAVEPVNSIVIAGPATVSVSCPDTSATCFVSYRKESD